MASESGSSNPHNQTDALPWIERWLQAMQPGARVLDFAAGSGRHARLAAGAGHQVLAVDRNADALAGCGDGISTLTCDLESAPWPFAGRQFDCVIVTNHLYRPRLDLLCGLIAPQGWLIYQTFAIGNEQFGRPSNPDFLLRPGELADLAARAGLTIAGYQHGLTDTPGPAVVQCLAASRRQPGDSPPILAA